MACWWNLRCLDAIDAAPTPGPENIGRRAPCAAHPSSDLKVRRGLGFVDGAPRTVDRRPLLGDDLRRRLLGGTVLHIAREHGALAGLAEADLVHGDCKPSNFLVSDKDDIILTDFGTCRERNAPADDAAVVGTPALRFIKCVKRRGAVAKRRPGGRAPTPSPTYSQAGCRSPPTTTIVPRSKPRPTRRSPTRRTPSLPDLLCASSRKGEADFDVAARVCAAFLREARLARVKVGTRTTPRSYRPFLMSSRTGARRACPGTTPGRSTWRTTARELCSCTLSRHSHRVRETRPPRPRPSYAVAPSSGGHTKKSKHAGCDDDTPGGCGGGRRRG